ncbi:MAG: enolase C-terminal domain-like protein [Pseudomonadota bacterium]
MKIKRIIIEELEIPFKHTFSHASATRNKTEAILVTVESENGFIGYGEGCPRNYVTGETIQTTKIFFADHKDEIINMYHLDDIKEWINNNHQVIDRNPAAWCAIELALLDVLAQEARISIESLLSLDELSGRFQYTAILGSSNITSYFKQLQQYMHAGFQDYKIKISGQFNDDKQKINALIGLENDIRVRLDANNFWDNAEQAIEYIITLNYPFFAIEEPLKPFDYNGCRNIMDKINIPIILDESFLKIQQFCNISIDPQTWVINLRISKMGGILRSLSITEQAKKYNIPIIIGAQVGETSILTRAALTVANSYRGIIIAQEGAFGTHLLEYDIIEESIMFGNNGILQIESAEK